MQYGNILKINILIKRDYKPNKPRLKMQPIDSLQSGRKTLRPVWLHLVSIKYIIYWMLNTFKKNRQIVKWIKFLIKHKNWSIF